MQTSATLTAALLVLGLFFGVDDAWSAEGPRLAIVPWQAVTPGQPFRASPLNVFWIPASLEDFRHSELLSFRPLLEYDSQCVGLKVLRADDSERMQQLGITGELPAAVLTSASGVVLSRVERRNGDLTGPAVDQALRNELHSREESAARDLDDAPRKLAVGDREGAVELYRRVCEQRCFVPRHAREAERALHRLGVRSTADAHDAKPR